ncbi:MAG: transketolase [Opitutales bacterium]|nr:transketolase [Opitutales bacterium]
MTDKEILKNAANEARGLAIDAVAARNSGHLGLPLGCAEIGAVLFGEILNIDPKKTDWLNRDRFVLSGGHGSMFLYSWLHISGFALTKDDVASFRLKGSKTPGHPEFGETAGVEATSGPLGQGIANAVGMAISEKMAQARFNTPEQKIIDHKVFCLAGDGCFQEGISSEASAIAAHYKLDNLILIYDSNGVTLDAAAAKSQSEDTAKRYQAYGFEVFTADGHDLDAVRATLKKAIKRENGKPKLVIFKTTIAKGIAEVEGTNKGHGEGGAKFAEAARKALGLPEEKFFVSPATYEYFARLAKKRARKRRAWEKNFEAWKAANPQKAEELDICLNKKEIFSDAKKLLSFIPEFPNTDHSASRVSGGVILNALAKRMPNIVSGSADLYGSTKNYIKEGGDFSPECPQGRNIYYGIREHAMGAITNGISYYGLFTPSCATFLTFAGYMMGSIRVAALSNLPVQYIFTHDSIGVGMDGPTHQPVELVSILRSIPRLDVVRPADSEEAAGAFAHAFSRQNGSTALILSRQDLPMINEIPVQTRREGVLKGAYIARRETQPLERILIATGSELLLALQAADILGYGTRVVSMPCMEQFERQSAEYKESVLPSACKNRTAVEAGVSLPWGKYAAKFVGTDDFGFSADGKDLMQHFGLTPENVAAVAK